MNKQECINQIFKEIMFSKPDHPLTIVCCFHSRKDMQNFIKSFFDKFFHNMKTKISLETVHNWTFSDCFSTTVLENRIFFLHDNCKCIDGINPDLFYYQEGFYYSQIIDFFKFRLKCVKNSQMYSFE